MKHELEPLKRIQTERYGEQPPQEERRIHSIHRGEICLNPKWMDKMKVGDIVQVTNGGNEVIQTLEIKIRKVAEEIKHPTPPETGNDFDGLDI